MCERYSFQFRSYLLALDNGGSCTTADRVATLLNQDVGRFARKYGGGESIKRLEHVYRTIVSGAIFCKRPVRRLEVELPEVPETLAKSLLVSDLLL